MSPSELSLLGSSGSGLDGPVLFVHAHPDDETLATGALIAHLTRAGTEVAVLTATRGEMGEVVPGALPADASGPDLVLARAAELRGALAVLGVTRSAYLGEPPARAAGLAPRPYRDSGMRWVTPEVAGPAAESDERSLTAAPLEEVVDDLCAWIELLGPRLLISYDASGSYGHPDHVRCHHATAEAARRAGITALEVVSGTEAGPDDQDAEWLELEAERDTVVAALRHHASQLTVVPAGAGEHAGVRHVGGQQEEVAVRIGLRRMRLTAAGSGPTPRT